MLSVPANATGEIVDHGRDWSVISVTFYREEPIDELLRLTVSDPDGGQFVDVERITSYAVTSVCLLSQIAAMALYPESESGLTCTGIECKAGAVIHQRFEPDRFPARVDFTLCRNDVCNELPDFQGAWQEMTDGPLFGGILLVRDSKAVELTASVYGETSVLEDGDRYRLLVTDAQTKQPITTIDRVVRYDSSYLNGPACDARPCRTVRIEGP